jgi:aspartate carbamoyltransferase catalytic subunit
MSDVTPVGGGQGPGSQSDPIQEAEANAEAYRNMASDEQVAGTHDMAYYLKLQRAMMEEQQAYSAISNIMKARSDAALNAVRNFR